MMLKGVFLADRHCFIGSRRLFHLRDEALPGLDLLWCFDGWRGTGCSGAGRLQTPLKSDHCLDAAVKEATIKVKFLHRSLCGILDSSSNGVTLPQTCFYSKPTYPNSGNQLTHLSNEPATNEDDSIPAERLSEQSLSIPRRSRGRGLFSPTSACNRWRSSIFFSTAHRPSSTRFSMNSGARGPRLFPVPPGSSGCQVVERRNHLFSGTLGRRGGSVSVLGCRLTHLFKNVI
ncbi:unnamed protein product [Pleuronectes platessa]|uniref:Uncharacterized protein n=1 Tax=Pleuronectes platessa TaxID=8262 RepID=A0A9N7VQF6_PLEPL|nr:unnamed protein product [Pleuronectes platessa]